MAITYKDLENEFNVSLTALYPQEEIKQLFLLSIAHTSGINSLQYSFQKNDNVPLKIVEELRLISHDLQSGRPIQHILGEAPFYKNIFKVSADTLIPRPETEELVYKIIQDHHHISELSIIDVGTGSGCIPITLALNLPQSNVWAVDISHPAINIAKENAQRLKADVKFVEADILEWEYIFDRDQKFDIIVSNPPYITPKEKETMHSNVLNFEPHLALFVEDEAPLLFYDYIADFGLTHLSTSGTLYFEINQYLSNETADLLHKKGYQNVEILKDINGADRIIKAKLV